MAPEIQVSIDLTMSTPYDAGHRRWNLTGYCDNARVESVMRRIEDVITRDNEVYFYHEEEEMRRRRGREYQQRCMSSLLVPNFLP